MISYKFSEEERQRALRVGRERREFHAARSTRDAFGLSTDDITKLHMDQQGALSELVVATLLGHADDWVEVTSRYKTLPGDVMAKVQVRSRSRSHYKLILHPNDPDDQIVVSCNLYRAKSEGIVDVVGWTWIGEAKRPEFWPGHNPSRPCFMVPNDVLVPGLDDFPFECLTA